MAQLAGALPSLTVIGGDNRGIISFVHASLAAEEVCARLSAEGVNAWVNRPAGAPLDSTTGAMLPSVRLSPHYVTDASDLARLDRALRSLP